jgi:hypothetical protein
MAKSLRSIFFDVTAALNSRGKRINFKTDGQPDEALMQNLVDSATFFAEEDDRARQAAGGAVADEVGLVTIAPDSEAKAGTSGLTSSRTKVTHASQLPTSEAESQTVDSFTGTVMDVTAEVATTTRNQYKFKWSAAFVAWIVNKVLPDFVVGDAQKIVRLNAGGTAYELVTFASQETGEANTVSHAAAGTGTGLIYKTKTAVDLIFKKILQGAYTTVTNGTDDITVAVDGAALVTALVDPIYTKAGANAGAGAQVYKGLSGTALELRSIVQGANTGVDINQNANDIDLAVNDTYVNGLIDARIAAIGVEGTSYLFSAAKISEQFWDYDEAGTPIITFTDDSSAGNYDYGNVWITSRWTANADAVTDTPITFNANVVFELTQTILPGAAADTIDCAVQFYKNGLATGASDTITFTEGVDAIGTTKSATLLESIAVALNDYIEIKLTITDSAGTTAGSVKATTDCRIWNEE